MNAFLHVCGFVPGGLATHLRKAFGSVLGGSGLAGLPGGVRSVLGAPSGAIGHQVCFDEINRLFHRSSLANDFRVIISCWHDPQLFSGNR